MLNGSSTERQANRTEYSSCTMEICFYLLWDAAFGTLLLYSFRFFLFFVGSARIFRWTDVHVKTQRECSPHEKRHILLDQRRPLVPQILFAQ